tara:strand:+ start:1395 stop:1727 length:333 start_codon:yes stop_codon:yes gene_type:complete
MLTIETMTIINGNADDDTVIINGETLFFTVGSLLPSNDIWAVQYKDGEGEIEWRDMHNDKITDIEQFQPVINKFYELKAEEVAAQEIAKASEAAEENFKASIAKAESYTQ